MIWQFPMVTSLMSGMSESTTCSNSHNSKQLLLQPSLTGLEKWRSHWVWVGELRKEVPISMSYIHPNLAKESGNREMLASDMTS